VRVLLLTQYYHPEPVEKVHDLARGLVRRGHEVEVLTGFPCYPVGKIYAGYRQRLVRREELDGVKILRVPQIPDHSRSAVRRAVYYLSFAVAAAAVGPMTARRPDVIIVYQAALPVGLTGRFLGALFGAPYVLDVVDLWPESVTSSGFVRSPFVEGVIRTVVKFIYAGAARISLVTDGFRRKVEAMGVDPANLTVIENWMPSETYRMEKPDPALAAIEGLSGKFVVMYAGNMGEAQGLRTVIEAAGQLRDERDICFALVGSGTEYEVLRGLAAERSLENVRFLGRRSPAEMPGLYALADVLLVHLKPDLLTDVSIPSKTFAYMSTGKPVIMAVRGDAAEFVTANGFGVAIEPANPSALAGAVLDMKRRPAEERERLGAAGVEALRERYGSEPQIARFETLLHSVTSRV
jgi:glycosyltransferase involved in cell wall biosynthesis